MDKLIYCVLLSDLLGMLIYLIWRLFEKKYDSQEYVTAIYAGLHLVVVLVFVLMILGIAASLYVWNSAHLGRILIPTPAMICIGVSLSCLWLAGTLYMLGEFLWYHFVHHMLIGSLFHADIEKQNRLEQAMALLGIRSKHITLYTGYAISTPEMTGFFHPRICIPVEKYSDEDLKNILVHELIHYKCKDKWIRELGVLLLCIHWFNPLIRKMVESLAWWDEVHCDNCVCEHTTPYQYGQTLMFVYDKIRTNRHRYESIQFVFISFSEQGNRMVERLNRIMAHKASIKQKRRVLVPMTLAFALALTGTSLAAEPLLRGINDQAYELTVYEVIDDDTCDIYDTYDAYNTYSEADDTIEYIEYEEVLDLTAFASQDPGITPNASPNGTINFSMGNNVWTSGAFKASSGQTITVLVSVSPSDVEIKVGIVDPDGIYRYVPGSDTINHPFVLTKTGYYQVVIKNETNNTITVIGAYTTSSAS